MNQRAVPLAHHSLGTDHLASHKCQNVNLYGDCSDVVFCFLAKLLQAFSWDCFKQALSPPPQVMAEQHFPPRCPLLGLSGGATLFWWALGQ